VAIDELPQVRHWVRNLPRYPEFSFWLPTASDRFYPDFVCELDDGRVLVVEYKGADRESDNDSHEKRLIGDYWAAVSGNLFLMALARDAQGRGVREQLLALLDANRLVAVAGTFAEHQRVRVLHACAAEGYQVPAEAIGTVVSVYAGGQAYAVEFENLGGEMAVVTLSAEQLSQALVQ
jgi:type III restriction enzyme